MSDSSLHDGVGDFDLSESYVNSVMSSQTVLNTPVTEIFSKSRRKRHLSMPAVQDSAKKLCGVGSVNHDLIMGVERDNTFTDNSDDSEQSQNQGKSMSENNKNKKVVTAKKKLYKSPKKESELICTAASVHVDADVSVKDMICQMNNTMQSLFSSLNDKIKQMEHNIENKLISKFNQQIDKRVNSENRKLKNEMETQMSSLRTDLCDDIAEINARLNSMGENIQTSASDGKPPNMERNIVIRNLPHTLNENLRGKVTGLLRDGLKLTEVVVDNVERKESRVESVPAVVVVTLASKEDKVNILRVKANLIRNHRYKRVFIHPDMSKRERQLAANFRKVVNAVQNSDVKLFVKGSRVCSSKWSSADDSTPTHDNSYGRNFRGEQRTHDFQRDEHEEMDICLQFMAGR